VRERTGAYRLMVGKTEGKSSLGNPWQRGKNNTEIKDRRGCGLECSGLERDQGWVL
jgi:hypothetical protein